MATTACRQKIRVPQFICAAGRGGEMTFDQIGRKLGISGVRARELYLKGMNKLRMQLTRRQIA